MVVVVIGVVDNCGDGDRDGFGVSVVYLGINVKFSEYGSCGSRVSRNVWEFGVGRVRGRIYGG